VPLVLVSATQPASTLACQPQPVSVVTAMAVAPPAAPMVCVTGETSYRQGAGCCWTGIFWSLTAISPCRIVPSGLAVA